MHASWHGVGRCLEFPLEKVEYVRKTPPATIFHVSLTQTHSKVGWWIFNGGIYIYIYIYKE
jgi:hypothetical protein